MAEKNKFRVKKLLDTINSLDHEKGTTELRVIRYNKEGKAGSVAYIEITLKDLFKAAGDARRQVNRNHRPLAATKVHMDMCLSPKYESEAYHDVKIKASVKKDAGSAGGFVGFCDYLRVRNPK